MNVAECARDIAGDVVLAQREHAVLDGVGPAAVDAERLADANEEHERLPEALARLLEVHNRGACTACDRLEIKCRQHTGARAYMMLMACAAAC